MSADASSGDADPTSDPASATATASESATASSTTTGDSDGTTGGSSTGGESSTSGDDDSTTAGGSSSEGSSSTGGEDVGIDLPATLSTPFIFPQERGGALCNNVFNGERSYSLSGSLNCASFTPYMVFRRSPDGEYVARMQQLEADKGVYEDAEFLDWSHGVEGMYAGSDGYLRELPEGVDITVETTFHDVVTFRFDDDVFTLLDFDPK